MGEEERRGRASPDEEAQKAKVIVEQLESGSGIGCRHLSASEIFFSSKTVSKIFLLTSCRECLSVFLIESSNFQSRQAFHSFSLILEPVFSNRICRKNKSSPL